MRRFPLPIAAAFVAAATLTLVFALRHGAPQAHLAAVKPAPTTTPVPTATPRVATPTATRTPVVPSSTPTIRPTATPTFTAPALPHPQSARHPVLRPTPTKAPRHAASPTAPPRAVASGGTATGVSQPPPTATVGASKPTQAAAPAPSNPTPGPYTPGVTIDVPRLGVHAAVYDRGIDANRQLPIAPGYAVTHYKFSAALGAHGNYVVYGHDDIEGSIFRYLPIMQVGDNIYLSTGGRRYTYRVTGSLVVSPDDVAVLNPTPDATITLISCTPYWVDTQRIVVKGVLVA